MSLEPTTHPVMDWLIALAAICVIIVCVLVGFSIYSQARAQDARPSYKLTWIAAVPVPGRQTLVGDIQEKARFKTEAECNAFGRDMGSRLQDWVRGRFNADWEHPVGVRFKCEIDGQPA